MASTPAPDELVAFHEFLTHRISSGEIDLSPEDSVRAFRTYQQELADFRQQLADSRDLAARGEAQPLDVDELKQKVRQRLSQDGITD